MKKVSVIGLFCTGQDVADGQSVKTRIVTQELEKALGADQVRRIDTYGWKKNPIKLFLNCIMSVWDSSNVVFMTDEGGIKIFPWLLRLANCFAACSLHYIVVGGWLIHFLKKHAFIRACLKKFAGIYVETNVMKSALEELGFDNIVLLPNFKPLTPVAPDHLLKKHTEPFRYCTFSRVMKEKGIDDAVEAICAVNSRFGKTVCTLDIYGQVDPGQAEWFASLQESFPPEIRYCGVVDYARSVDVLKDYFALLFPTEFFTEGVPGTIIDAYAAGIPVIAAKWESFADVIDDGVTGFGYPFGNQESLREWIESFVCDPERVHGMKAACLQKADRYLPEHVLEILFSKLS